ncbi:MAG: hypothetical protein ABI679_13535 [Gemmatimonadota bacterium]
MSIRGTASLALATLILGACNRSTSEKTWSVSIRGYGPIHAGMTIAEATAAGGRPLTLPAPDGESCDMIGFAGDSSGAVRFMVIRGVIKRVDVYRDSTVKTMHGIHIGDPESRVEKAYPGRVRVEPHKYEDGHYLIVGPSDSTDSGFEVVFETDGKQVTQYRAGQVPEVEMVEGCS